MNSNNAIHKVVVVVDDDDDDGDDAHLQKDPSPPPHPFLPRNNKQTKRQTYTPKIDKIIYTK